jgi:BioD-like phosphotransacetylase family protein
MRPLFLSSVMECSGKSMVALGLAKNYKGKVGYYKPFREDVLCIDNRVVDRDTYLMKKALDLEYSEEMMSPLKYDVSVWIASRPGSNGSKAMLSS